MWTVAIAHYVVSMPVGTPQHTMKKNYVVEALYMYLIKHLAPVERVEVKDVVNLAFQEFFGRWHCPWQGGAITDPEEH